jgi:deoxyribodipyrimidine photo-lyase
MAYDDSDIRHWRFIYESLQEMQSKLKLVDAIATKFIFFIMKCNQFLRIAKIYDVKTVFSHQEIGNKITFDRDIAMQSFFDDNTIHWKQSQMHGVIRKLKSRKDWDKRWENVMRAEPKMIDLNEFKTETLETNFYTKFKR